MLQIRVVLSPHVNYSVCVLILIAFSCFQAANNLEYVLEAEDVNAMKSWLSAIQMCMKPAEIETTLTER